MSTPVDLNIAMPYGVTVVGDGTNNPKLVAPHPRQLQNFGLKLPPGPCRIAASWEGDEKVGVVVQTSGTRNYRTVGNIPERSGGGVLVKGCSPSGRSKTTTCTSAGTSSRRERRAPWRFTRSTSSNAPHQGGGVGDHPEHRRGRLAHNQVVRGGVTAKPGEYRHIRAVFSPVHGCVHGDYHDAGRWGQSAPVNRIEVHNPVSLGGYPGGAAGSAVEHRPRRGHLSVSGDSAGQVRYRRGHHGNHLPAVAAGGGVR